MLLKDNAKKNIDSFIIMSLILWCISISGYIIFAHNGILWSEPVVLSEIIYQMLTWAFVSLISLILMTIGVIRSKVKQNTRNLGFALTIPIVAIESLCAFLGLAALAIIVVVAYIATHKLWKT